MVRQELGVLYRGLAQLAPQLRRRGQQGPAAVTFIDSYILRWILVMLFRGQSRWRQRNDMVEQIKGSISDA